MTGSERACKVDRVADRWELRGIDDRLRERWDAGATLRELETQFNEAVLDAALRSQGAQPLAGETETIYRLLTEKDGSPGDRVEAESRLSRAGVDPETVTDDFVSYQTVRTHLNDCLGVSTDRQSSLSVSDARTTVLKLLSRTESVTQRTVERLAADGPITIAAPSVTLSLRVACSECDEEYTFTGLLDRGGCSCGD